MEVVENAEENLQDVEGQAGEGGLREFIKNDGRKKEPAPCDVSDPV